ncbi:hypothetical protein BDP81DRAFT_158283 [Colletotrichum phormii]|uniref:Secreted protein n=1 Tax=Colletotrichum phormii TaxID=359342 RepID=A0AAI9ZXL8_9PEZI|nr:uncharacterized protein BDP81DRAFT_158283 [Colletotrichum phormii]KAK1640092.1 hypothetical protein BDP81DRAFT_158283 [Colletotrichum phormii]
MRNQPRGPLVLLLPCRLRSSFSLFAAQLATMASSIQINSTDPDSVFEPKSSATCLLGPESGHRPLFAPPRVLAFILL